MKRGIYLNTLLKLVIMLCAGTAGILTIICCSELRFHLPPGTALSDDENTDLENSLPATGALFKLTETKHGNLTFTVFHNSHQYLSLRSDTVVFRSRITDFTSLARLRGNGIWVATLGLFLAIILAARRQFRYIVYLFHFGTAIWMWLEIQHLDPDLWEKSADPESSGITLLSEYRKMPWITRSLSSYEFRDESGTDFMTWRTTTPFLGRAGNGFANVTFFPKGWRLFSLALGVSFCILALTQLLAFLSNLMRQRRKRDRL